MRLERWGLGRFQQGRLTRATEDFCVVRKLLHRRGQLDGGCRHLHILDISEAHGVWKGQILNQQSGSRLTLKKALVEYSLHRKSSQNFQDQVKGQGLASCWVGGLWKRREPMASIQQLEGEGTQADCLQRQLYPSPASSLNPARLP